MHSSNNQPRIVDTYHVMRFGKLCLVLACKGGNYQSQLVRGENTGKTAEACPPFAAEFSADTAMVLQEIRSSVNQLTLSAVQPSHLICGFCSG
jgi:hypothetical protein